MDSKQVHETANGGFSFVTLYSTNHYVSLLHAFLQQGEHLVSLVVINLRLPSLLGGNCKVSLSHATL